MTETDVDRAVRAITQANTLVMRAMPLQAQLWREDTEADRALAKERLNREQADMEARRAGYRVN